MGLSTISQISQTAGRTSTFKIAVKLLEIDENVNRAHFTTPWLAVKWCHGQLCSFLQILKWATRDNARYVWSSSGLITVVVMTLILNDTLAICHLKVAMYDGCALLDHLGCDNITDNWFGFTSGYDVTFSYYSSISDYLHSNWHSL